MATKMVTVAQPLNFFRPEPIKAVLFLNTKPKTKKNPATNIAGFYI